MIEVVDEVGLEKQVKANPKVVALFYASWCPFCRNFLPVFDRYAQASDGAVYMKVRIDKDENPLWETYGFEAVPSVILFEGGEVSRRLDCNLGRGLTESQFSRWLAAAP